MATMRNDALSHTHQSPDKLTLDQIADELEAIKSKLMARFHDKPETLDGLLNQVNELSNFELGRFLIKNKGALSGYWTWYIIQGFNNTNITSPIERFIVEKAPVILATQERFAIFQQLLLKHIQANSVVCSIPCGVMADLLTLKLPEEVLDVRFIGIDLDSAVFDLAKDLSKQIGSRAHCEFFHRNAWTLEVKDEYDLITTNGLNIYEMDNTKVTALYRIFYAALKQNGRLICSALTPPPNQNSDSEWILSSADKENLPVATALFSVILEATWANFRTTEQTRAQLLTAGFDEVEVHRDSRGIFPTFCALKR